MHRGRGLIVGMAAAALLAIGQAAIGSAQASTTVTVAPTAGGSSNSFPFGRIDIWPTMAWVYKSVPAFNLKAGDNLAFDLQAMNDVDIQVAIALAPTTVNGNNIPAAGFTPIVSNSQVPANPRGNTTTGDYELRFTAEAPFSFPGGGLIIRIGSPGGAFLGDAVDNSVFLNNLAMGSDPSGYFVERVVGDPDGIYPWTGTTLTNYIAGFQLTLADVPPANPTPVTTTPPPTPAAKKKCKKHKRSAAAAKKCKKRKK
jgi:hypothetical protein